MDGDWRDEQDEASRVYGQGGVKILELVEHEVSQGDLRIQEEDDEMFLVVEPDTWCGEEAVVHTLQHAFTTVGTVVGSRRDINLKKRDIGDYHGNLCADLGI